MIPPLEGEGSFNPCFYGMCSQSGVFGIVKTALLQFQSLFLWNVLVELLTVEKLWQSSSSFNPCFYGMCSQRLAVREEGEQGICFNPCFYGMCSQSVSWPHLRYYPGSFQSLFLWNVLVESPIPRCSSSAVRFQSLFLWNVLVERNFVQHISGSFLFQSLFLWNVLVEIGLVKDYFSDSGFNPCFYGMCSQRAAGGRVRDRAALFQSLFLWNVLVETRSSRRTGRRACVSILVFMECARRVIAWALWSKRWSSFNPCFYGMCSQSNACPRTRPIQSLVSILVFMECARRAYCSRSVITVSPGFNPCFYGMCSQRACLPFTAARLAVSILVFMECARRAQIGCMHPLLPFFVSILVFMECARRDLTLSLDDREYPGFNPCFYGMCSQSHNKP